MPLRPQVQGTHELQEFLGRARGLVSACRQGRYHGCPVAWAAQCPVALVMGSRSGWSGKAGSDPFVL